ncbi:hypothetical protein GLOIN_2v1692140 [Rhizophagus irregularis DAOM 181602=DAOM 197198]|nr:hypothetical protein GLOIN_2v1692140 [Rhizophagus irregularis DAOM 181602=DAOM 197198]
MSMVGRRFLAIIDLLRLCFPACDVPGLSRSYGRSAYSQLQEIYKLEAMQRQQVTRINNNNSEISHHLRDGRRG